MACAPVRRAPTVTLAAGAAALEALATLSHGEQSYAIGVLADILDAPGADWLVDALEEQATDGGNQRSGRRRFERLPRAYGAACFAARRASTSPWQACGAHQHPSVLCASSPSWATSSG